MGFRDDLRTSVRAAACGLFNNYDTLNRWGAGFTAGNAGLAVYPSTPAGRLANSGMALFCDRPPFDEPTPVAGGRCPGTYYLVTAEGVVSYGGQNYPNSSGVTWQSTNIANNIGATGPIGGPLSIGQTTGGGVNTFGPSISWADGSADGQFGMAAIANDGTGFNASNEAFQRIDSARITNISVISGPDNCGDVPPPIPPPLPLPDRTIDIDINNQGGQIAIGNGIIQVNGDLIVPFNLTGPSFSYSGQLNINTGDIDFNFGGLPGDKPCLTPDPAEGDPDEPPEDGQGYIIGVVAISLFDNLPGTTQKFQGDNPDIYVPRIGTVSFLVRIGELDAWTTDLPVKSKQQYIQNPASFGAVAVRGTPENGVNWRLIPIRAIVDPVEFT